MENLPPRFNIYGGVFVNESSLERKKKGSICGRPFRTTLIYGDVNKMENKGITLKEGLIKWK
jgi:hypothetical protein